MKKSVILLVLPLLLPFFSSNEIKALEAQELLSREFVRIIAEEEIPALPPEIYLLDFHSAFPELPVELIEFQSQLPQFPIEVVYIVDREFETIIEGISPKDVMYYSVTLGHLVYVPSLGRYNFIELRLRDLFPELAYEGMVYEMMAEMESLISVYEYYLEEVRIWKENNGVEMFELPVPHAFFYNKAAFLIVFGNFFDEQTRLRDMVMAPVYATLEDMAIVLDYLERTHRCCSSACSIVRQ